MEQTYVGIDVAKDRLDVHVRPSGEAFKVPRDSDGLTALIERLRALTPALVVGSSSLVMPAKPVPAQAGSGHPRVSLTVGHKRTWMPGPRRIARLLTS